MSMLDFFKRKPKLTKAQAQEEVDEMVRIYWEEYPAIGNKYGFLVGSSHRGNKQGDSARFHELKAILTKS